jgi:hypothetical protein
MTGRRSHFELWIKYNEQHTGRYVDSSWEVLR